MRTTQQLAQEAQQMLDETPVGDWLLLANNLRSRDTMRLLAERMEYIGQTT